MAFTLSINPRPGFLHARITGENSVATVQGYMAQLRAACQSHRCPDVLIEENLTGPGLQSFDIFGMISGGARETSQALGRIAYVDTNPEHERRLMQFAETVAVNRGVSIRVFATVADAEAWITAPAAAERRA